MTLYKRFGLAFCLVFLVHPAFSGISIDRGSSFNASAQWLQRTNLWVDAQNGSDLSDGTTRERAFQTIQKAAETASPGTIVHILPGIYRETVIPVQSGTKAAPIVYQAEEGPGTVTIRGSEAGTTFSWVRLAYDTIGLPYGIDPSNIYYADLSSLSLASSPRFLVELGQEGEFSARLPVSREPDWQVTTDWKTHEFWWSADGGNAVPTCDPSTDSDADCDLDTRSTYQLIDYQTDTTPAGIEPGNLTTLGNLIGATLVALDTQEGHYVYRRAITGHFIDSGVIQVDRSCEFDSGSGKGGLGWGTKYYVENSPVLLDTPGEWWYDAGTSRLYLWPADNRDPSQTNLEISVRDMGFKLFDKSYITLDGITLEYFNESAYHQSQSCSDCTALNNTLRNLVIRYANYGVELGQGTSSSAGITDGFLLEDSEISHIDSQGIYMNYWWPDNTADTFTHPGITNTVIRNNELYELSFRNDSDNADGLQFNYADHLLFEGNYVHHVAHNGMILFRSVIQSDKESDFDPQEIKTGDILIKDNVFEYACMLATDCGEIKIVGTVPDYHVFRDVLVTGNIFRNTYGWSSVAEKRGSWSGGSGSDVKGMGGFGFYLDYASGVHVYRNIAYNNASTGYHLYSHWWDGDVVIYNNIAANSLNGIRLDGWSSTGSVNTRIANNILLNNEAYGVLIYLPQGDEGDFYLNYNLYSQNGWRKKSVGGVTRAGAMALYGPTGYYPSLSEIQSNTVWEINGLQLPVQFAAYNADEHNLFNTSLPDFHLAANFTGLADMGSAELPSSLVELLEQFSVPDFRAGQAYEIGRYEDGFLLIVQPVQQGVSPGGTAEYTISVFPSDLSFPVSVQLQQPADDWKYALSSSQLQGGQSIVLSISAAHIDLLLPGKYDTFTLTAAGGGYQNTIELKIYAGLSLPAYFPPQESH